ncbi:MAG: FAD-dependent oxidoreductase [Armatimonadetes bacterium]|nr:FAD-dependent oxidoreductase [Armatimonadota bacterium]
MGETIREPAREIPVTHEADVVVAGGGTAGVACAVCAARLGLSVIMVENTVQPGGMVTHVTQWTNDFDNKGGFAREFYEHLVENGILVRPYYNPFRVVPYLDSLLEEAGVLPLYLCRVAAPIVEDGELQGVIVESKQGRHAIRARVVVDATGDGDVAAFAGASFEFGREGDGAIQSISLTHSMQGFPRDRVHLRDELLPMLRQVDPECQLVYDNGYIRRQVDTRAGLLFGTPHVFGYNPLDAESLSAALVALRKQTVELFNLMRQTEIGAELEFGPFGGLPGVRESRRICCDARVTVDDLRAGRSRPDGLFTVTQSIDIHKRVPEDPAIIVERIQPYEIPYGALLPKGLERILVVGRCIGGDHEAQASYRIIADCFAMGEAAALAAHAAVRGGVGLREIDVPALVAEMARRGYKNSHSTASA